MSQPEIIKRSPQPKESGYYIKNRIFRFSLPYDLAMDIHEIAKDIKEKDKIVLLSSFIKLRMEIDQLLKKPQNQDKPLLAVGKKPLSKDGHLETYRPIPKDHQNLFLNDDQLNLIRNLARSRQVKSAAYAAQAIALGCKIMREAQNQISFPVAVALTIGDQDYLFRYQDKHQVLTPITLKREKNCI